MKKVHVQLSTELQFPEIEEAMSKLIKSLLGADVSIFLDHQDREWLIGREEGLVRIEVRRSYDASEIFTAHLSKASACKLAALMRGVAAECEEDV